MTIGDRVRINQGVIIDERQTPFKRCYLVKVGSEYIWVDQDLLSRESDINELQQDIKKD